MIALIQRVAEASVAVGGETAGAIGPGVLALVGVERGDGEAEAGRLAERVLGYRIFPDAAGKMNLSLRDIRGQLLAIPQFTLAADTDSGARPSFSSAASPDEGQRLFQKFVEKAGEVVPRLEMWRCTHRRPRVRRDRLPPNGSFVPSCEVYRKGSLDAPVPHRRRAQTNYRGSPLAAIYLHDRRCRLFSPQRRGTGRVPADIHRSQTRNSYHDSLLLVGPALR